MNRIAHTLLIASLTVGMTTRAQLGPVELSPERGQAGWSNPAILHPSGTVFTFGGFAGAQVDAVHSGPAYLDFGNLDGELNPMAFLGQMDTVESIGTRTEVPLVGLTMRDENRFEIRYRSRLVVDQDFRYDRDLLSVGWMGNGHPDLIGRPLSFSGMGVDAQAYLDHGLSVGAMAKEDKLWLGWGIHILNGVSALQTERFDATWMTDTLDYSWTLDGAATVNAAGLDFDSLAAGVSPELPGDGGIPPTLGSGVAFDVGFLWRLTPKFELEGSMEGRGSIRWLESVSRRQVDPSTFVLQGLDVIGVVSEAENQTFPDSLESMLETWAEDMVDSLAQAFDPEPTDGLPAAFDTRVRETWRLGFRFRPVESLEFQALAYRQFQYGRTLDGFIFGLVHRIRNNVATQVQGQYLRGRWSWGAGLSMRGGPLRLALSARNVAGILYPMQAGHWSGQVGVAFEFGYAKDKKRTKKKGIIRCLFSTQTDDNFLSNETQPSRD